MTIRHLKTFIAVCEAGGITKAAEQLHIAQPSVSQAISELEKFYNIQLFDRVNQRLVITDQGKLLLDKAKEVANSFDEFESMATSTDSNPSVRIGASLTIGKTFIPLLLDGIISRFPDVSPFVEINKTAVIEEKVIGGDLDFGIVEGTLSPSVIKSSAIRTVPFRRDRLVAVCGKDDPVPDEIPVRELVNYNLILREKGSSSRNMLDNVLSLHGLTAAPLIESVSSSAIISAVAHNLGIAVLPYDFVIPYVRAKKIRIIRTDVSFERESCIIFHKSKKFTSAQKEIFELCLALN